MVRLLRPRNDPPAPDVLVAATAVSSAEEFQRVRRRDASADTRAWSWYDQIGEVHFGISSGAREISRARLKAIRWEDPMSSADLSDGPVCDLVMAIQSEHGGQAGLLSSFYANRKVTGDGWFFGWPQKDDPGGRMWFDYLSTDELTTDGTRDGTRGKKLLRHRSPRGFNEGPEAKPESFSFDEVIVSRVWQPHPHWSDVADSPLKALDTVAEELDILTKALKAKITSRLATAGFLLFPSSMAMNFQPPPSPSGDPAKLAENPFVNWVMQQMTRAVMDPSDTSASVPFVFVVPDEAVELVRWITVESETFEVEIKQRAELISRLLAGLDLRPEQIEGFGDSNHWSAWSSQDVHLKVDIAPEMEALCWALTTSFLWPQLRELSRMPMSEGGLDARVSWTEDEIRRHWVWYDLRELTVRPNKADSYGELHDRGTISPKALREAAGATDEEAPSEEEYIRNFGFKHGDAYLATFGLDEQDEIDWEKVAAKTGPGPDPASPAQPSPTGPGKKQAGGPGDNRGNRRRSQTPQ